MVLVLDEVVQVDTLDVVGGLDGVGVEEHILVVEHDVCLASGELRALEEERIEVLVCNLEQDGIDLMELCVERGEREVRRCMVAVVSDRSPKHVEMVEHSLVPVDMLLLDVQVGGMIVLRGSWVVVDDGQLVYM